MPAVLKRNPREGEAPEAATKPNGGLYRYEMICDAGATRAYADFTADLFDVLIRGYADLDTDARLHARIKYATDLLAGLQAAIVADSPPADLTEPQRAVLMAPRHEPVTVAEWDAEVPLVLVDVHYAPYSDLPAPVSALEDVANPRNLIWLRPSDPDEFLLSLHRAGVIHLSEHNDYDA